MSAASEASASASSGSPRSGRSPRDAVRDALGKARRIVVVEKAFSIGFGGVLSTDVAMALQGLEPVVVTVVAGLGGRPITGASLDRVLESAGEDRLPPLTFLDLDVDVVRRELERMAASRRSGPTAENVLRDVGVVAAGPV